MGHIKGSGKERSRCECPFRIGHGFTDIPSPVRVIIGDNHLIAAVQRPPVQFKYGVGVLAGIALVHRFPLAVPEMAVIGPLTAVNARHGHTEGFDMDDVVIVRKQAATGRMSD